MFKIQTLNKISASGLSRLDRDNYEVATYINNPDAILVRSADMHEMKLSDSVKAVARAGAGTNNIPIPELTDKGVVVFNTPGANANAVKELVLLGLLVSSRPVIAANGWANGLSGNGDEIPDLAEKGKSKFVGPELKGKTLGVIGLGAIGAMVANTAIKLGMNVIGYDPFLSINAAWSLDHNVQHSETLEGIYKNADYITLHVPQTNDTKGMINASSLKMMKDGVRILNFSRDGLVNSTAVLEALKSGKVAKYVTDFPNSTVAGQDGVVVLPHLGASTEEAEDNCAVMAVKELRNYIENGNIINSVNYPACDMGVCNTAGRVAICQKNVPAVISKITRVMGDAGINIEEMANKSRGDYAYSLLDTATSVSDDVVGKLSGIDGVIKVRVVK